MKSHEWFDRGRRVCRIEQLVFLTRRPWGRRCDVGPLAIVAELADAHGSGPCTRKGVGVRVPSMAPIFCRLPRRPLGLKPERIASHYAALKGPLFHKRSFLWQVCAC